jgi:prepilin-type N-terminal cleavage/methylation domain-containing protein
MRRREHGLTLVEILVTIAVIGSSLLAVTELFELSLKAVASAGRGALAPSAWQSMAQLREDAQSAGSFPCGGARTGPLELNLGEDRSVVWHVKGNVLERREQDASGRVQGGGTVVTGVVGWQWRCIGLDLLEVRITVEHPPAASGLMTQKANPRWVRTTEVLRVARRGRNGGRSW